MRWPWSKPKNETRSSGGFTALSLQARAETIMGRRGQAELTAAVQTCVGLWEAALALSDVEGTDLLTPRTLALVARSLALRGEFCALIGDGALIPASDWDLSTSLSRPRAYRLSLPDVGGGETRTALAAEVVHVVIGADSREPWRGVPPLARASVTADLLATVEAALVETFADAPLGSTITPVPEMTEEDRERLAGSFRGRRGRVLLRESTVVTSAGAPAPSTEWRPQSLTPELDKSEVIATYDRARDAICQAFGVDPSLLSSMANGPGLREAQRHLATWVLQPIAARIGEEMTEKLGSPVSLDVVRPLGAVGHGGRARAAAQLIGAMAAAKAAGLTDEQVSEAFRFTNLHGITEG